MLRHSTILSVRFNQVEREKGGREGRGEEEDEEEEVEGGAGSGGQGQHVALCRKWFKIALKILLG